MVEEEDISDAVEDGSRGRERRRSFWRLSKAERDQDVFRKSCAQPSHAQHFGAIQSGRLKSKHQRRAQQMD